jgi:hypothetical protein
VCGLIGGTGKIEARYTIALGCLAESRGDESAGVAWDVEGKVRVAKIAQNPLVAFPVTLAPAIRHASRYAGVLIGHTRQATTGEVTDANAHPFFDKESGIAWAHNGVIHNHEEFGKFNVDSESLLAGIKERDFSKYHGPIALLWLEKGMIHAFRKSNPLFRGHRHKAVYLASTEAMLQAIGCKRIKELAEGRLYIFKGTELLSHETVPYHKGYTPTRQPIYEGHQWSDRYNSYGRTGPRIYDWEKKEWIDAVPVEPEHKCHTLCGKRKAFAERVHLLPSGSAAMDLRDSAFRNTEPDTLAEVDTQTATSQAQYCIECKNKVTAEGSDWCVECYVQGMGYGGGDY